MKTTPTITKTDVIGLQKYLNTHTPNIIRYNDCNHAEPLQLLLQV